jgi:HSP20 family protein
MNLRSLVPFRDRGSARGDINPFGSLHREIDRLFEDFTQGLVPAIPQKALNLVPRVDVTENDKEIVITAEMPGLTRNDVDISLEDNILTIRGEKVEIEEDGPEASGQAGASGQRSTSAQAGTAAQAADKRGGQAAPQGGKQAGNGQSGKNKTHHVRERSYGVFLRVFELPPGIDQSKIQATMQNGVLKLVIPKPAQSEAKKIEVKEAA